MSSITAAFNPALNSSVLCPYHSYWADHDFAVSKIAHFRAAQLGIEWAVEGGPCAREQLAHHGLLFWRQLFPRERFEPIATKIEFTGLLGDHNHGADQQNGGDQNSFGH